MDTISLPKKIIRTRKTEWKIKTGLSYSMKQCLYAHAEIFSTWPVDIYSYIWMWSVSYPPLIIACLEFTEVGGVAANLHDSYNEWLANQG